MWYNSACSWSFRSSFKMWRDKETRHSIKKKNQRRKTFTSWEKQRKWLYRLRSKALAYRGCWRAEHQLTPQSDHVRLLGWPCPRRQPEQVAPWSNLELGKENMYFPNEKSKDRDKKSITQENVMVGGGFKKQHTGLAKYFPVSINLEYIKMSSQKLFTPFSCRHQKMH